MRFVSVLQATAAVGLASLWFTTSARAADRVYDSFDHPDLRVADAQAIDNADGTYSYVNVSGLDERTFVKSGSLTWQYAGQASFGIPLNESASSNEVSFVYKSERPTVDELSRRLIRIDDAGRQWRVADRDAVLSDKNLARYDRRHGLTPDPYEPPAEPQKDWYEDGELVTWTQQSWDHFDCQAGNGNEVHVWDGDGRVTVGSPSDSQAAVVRVFDTVRGGICSGFLVRQKFVVTAAHCVYDDNNNLIDGDDFQVRRFDLPSASDTNTVKSMGVLARPNYGGGSVNCCGTDFDDDWTVLELDQTWTNLNSSNSRAEVMTMSQASDNTLENLSSVNNSFAACITTGCGQFLNTLRTNREFDDPVTALNNKRVRVRIDGSPGHSGSPVYFCPDSGSDEFCSTSEQGHAFMVWAGWAGSPTSRQVGPRVSFIRQSVLDFINQ